MFRKVGVLESWIRLLPAHLHQDAALSNHPPFAASSRCADAPTSSTVPPTPMVLQDLPYNPPNDIKRAILDSKQQWLQPPPVTSPPNASTNTIPTGVLNARLSSATYPQPPKPPTYGPLYQLSQPSLLSSFSSRRHSALLKYSSNNAVLGSRHGNLRIQILVMFPLV